MKLRLPGSEHNGATRTAVRDAGWRRRVRGVDQPQKELPQAQPPPAFGLSISKPCFSMVSV
jgi:hypothetical protein